MQKVAIVTDSIACLTRELVEQYGIGIIPLNFYFRGKVYRDWVDITPSEAYELFLEDPDSFKSSATSPGVCLDAYREASKEAASILCITLSTKISGVYNAAVEAKEIAESELPQTTVEVLDSETVTAAEGFVVLAAAKAAVEGKSLAEIAKVAEEMKDRVSFLAFLDTVRHVYRTGRIPKVVSQAGSILNIKPILTTSSGVLRAVGVARSRERGIEGLLRRMRDKVGQNPVHVAVMHAYAPDEAEKLKERISSEFNCVELWLTEFSPLMGYSCGTGTLGIAFYSED